jgi:hypothetical protein
MQINLAILALMKMVLHTSKTNPYIDKRKQISQFIAHENGFGCGQNQPRRKM